MRTPPDIGYLADRPEAIPTLARWHLAEWGRYSPRRTLETAQARLRGHLSRDAVPLTMLALEGDRPLGSAALVCQDMRTRPDLTPWLADVVVDPALRGRGIGSALVRRLVAKAAELGVERLYLYTPDQERLYARLGFQVLERVEYRGEEVVIMQIRPRESASG
jgi:predicted N-acetyltransferase YhbS